MITAASNTRVIAVLLFASLVVALCALLVPQASSSPRAGDGCIKLFETVSSKSILHTKVCFPDIGPGD